MTEILNLIKQTADLYGYDPARLAAQCWVESRLNPDAVSPAGATGLMQFMPKTWLWAQEMGWIPKGSDPTDPLSSLTAGIRYMQWLDLYYRRVPQNLSLCLAAYNAGQGTVDRAIRKSLSSDWRLVSPYLPQETQQYIPRVMDRIPYYAAMFKQDQQ